jgi:hypothetical protein
MLSPSILPVAEGDPTVVLIGGCPRSGTTLLASLLGEGQGCVVTPESHFKQLLLRDHAVNWQQGLSHALLQRDWTARARFRHWRTSLDLSELPDPLGREDYARLLLRLVAAYGRSHSRPLTQAWVDHTPHNLHDALRLSELFPTARFVHLVRDPRAVAASLLSLDWGPLDAQQAADYWARHLSWGLAAEQALPGRVQRVSYEQLVTQPVETLTALRQFCGLEPPPSGASAASAAYFLPAFTRQQHQWVGHAPNAARLDAWRRQLAAWQVLTIEHRLADLMPMLGYELSCASPLGAVPRPGLLRRWLWPRLCALPQRLRFLLKRWR